MRNPDGSWTEVGSVTWRQNPDGSWTQVPGAVGATWRQNPDGSWSQVPASGSEGDGRWTPPGGSGWTPPGGSGGSGPAWPSAPVPSPSPSQRPVAPAAPAARAPGECWAQHDGSDYRGVVAKTVKGDPCLNWQDFNATEVAEFPNSGLGDHNYCRHPYGFMCAWCHTLPDRHGRTWECCDIGQPDPYWCRGVRMHAETPVGARARRRQRVGVAAPGIAALGVALVGVAMRWRLRNRHRGGVLGDDGSGGVRML